MNLRKKFREAKKRVIDYGLGDLRITRGPDEDQGAYNKMRRYQSLYTMLNKGSIEYYAYMTSKPEEKDIVTDIYLAPDQNNSFASTYVTKEGVGKAAKAIAEWGHMLRGWTHLHPMNYFGSSGTDKENNEIIVTSLAHNSKTIRLKKEQNLELRLEGDELVAYNEHAAITTRLNLKKAGICCANPESLKELEGLMKQVKESYRTALYCHSMIIMGDPERQYLELVTFDTRIKEKKQVQCKVEFIEDPNAPKFTDRELIVDIMTKIKFSRPLKYIVENIKDRELRKSVWDEIKDKKDLPTKLDGWGFFSTRYKPMDDSGPSLVDDIKSGVKKIFSSQDDETEKEKNRVFIISKSEKPEKKSTKPYTLTKKKEEKEDDNETKQ